MSKLDDLKQKAGPQVQRARAATKAGLKKAGAATAVGMQKAGEARDKAAEKIGGWPRGRLAGLGVALAIVLFLAVNVLASNVFRGSRADLTENGLYSLSAGTRSLLTNLEEPIHMRLFLSKDLVQSAPQLSTYAQRVQSILEAYADLSNGKLTLEVIDPEPFSDAEDRAVGLGINRFTAGNASEPLFFGLAATNSTNGSAKIPVFAPDREQFLEYDITRVVADLGQPKKPVIAIVDRLGLSGNPMQRVPEQQIMAQLRELYKVELLTGEVDKLPEGTRVVMLVHPRNLSDRTLYTIDQWVLGGGATLVFADPHAETQPGLRPGMPPSNPKTDFGKVFDAWGVKFDADKAVADPNNGLRTVRQVFGRQVEVTNYPWLSIGRDGLKSDDAMFAQLSTIILTTAGAFETTSDKVQLEPLMFASAQAGLVPSADATNPAGDPRTLLGKIERAGKAPVLAARLSGAINSAFPDGKPDGSEFEGEHAAKPKASPNVILFGDADMLNDRNWIRQRRILGQTIAQAFANNGALVLNAVEQMTGGSALAGLRGRAVSWRPFEKIETLAKEAETEYLAEQQKLTQKLRATEQRIAQVSQKAGGDGDLLSDESAKAIAQFRSELLATRAELRNVQFELRRDVDSLKSWITMLNVGIFPAIFAALALFFAFRRPSRPEPKRNA